MSGMIFKKLFLVLVLEASFSQRFQPDGNDDGWVLLVGICVRFRLASQPVPINIRLAC